MAVVVCLGEGMLELARAADAGEQWRLHYGGDTLSTAVHLARAGHSVLYMTALGADPFSSRLRSHWEAEGIDCGLVLTHPTRQAGLYAIDTDPHGERSFSYWREGSAAGALFETPGIEEAAADAEMADVFCFSLMSLAVLPPEGREQLLALARRVRARGGTVAFDGTYRPDLWESAETARAARDAAIAVAQIGLPTLEDEAVLGGSASPQEVAAHWEALGCQEVVVKLGVGGCLLPGGAAFPVSDGLQAIDASGAGDAFNGGYLSGRILGDDPAEAARAGHALAGWVAMRHGAIPVREADAPYRMKA